MTTYPSLHARLYSMKLPTGFEPEARGNMSKPNEPFAWGTGPLPWALVSAAIIVLLDVNTSRAFSVGALYAIPVLIASLTARRAAVLAVAGLASALIVVGLFFSTGPGPEPEHFVNRAIALLLVWAPAAVALRLAAMKAGLAYRAERERLAASELHESIRIGLNKLLTLADQIGRSGATVQEAGQRVRARAQVMLTVLGILSRSRGAPVDLGATLRSMLPASSSDVLRMEGPPVLVSPRQVHAIVQVFHELLGNCRAHGALSTDEGRIEVTWTVEPVTGEHAQRVTLNWSERGGRAIPARPEPGFGTSVISGTVVHDLSGSVELEYPEEGCRHHLRFIVDDANAGARRGGR